MILKKIVIQDQFKRIAKIEINPEIISKDSLEGLNWRTRLNLAISENKKLGLHAHKSNKIIEIDECLIAVEGINKSEIFIFSSLVFLTFFFGIYPEPLFSTIDISVSNLIDNYQANLNFHLVQVKN